ncbi:MAG: glycoside hydrolase family 57 protein [Chloroflexi bacterium]|nr:MAG: glycoside hydrolase family 57 protein [Chloroflexota bacterium]
MTSVGTFVLALHSHLPYCRGAGRWPHGEEWIHEAVLGTYLPLLVLLHDLRDAGVPYRIVIGLTPVLIEQLADQDVDVRSLEYIDDQVRRAQKDIRRFVDAGDPQRAALADFYLGSYRRLRDAYRSRFGRNLVGAFADLARTGHVEILTSAATHGYLPLLDRASVEAQLRIGLRSSKRLLGLEPTGIWLPECAYAPGLETVLEEHGITHFFTDAALLPGHAQPALAGSRRRGHSELRRAPPHEARVATALAPEASDVDLLRPYYVGASDVVAIARHDRVSGQVWSAFMGYPGDPAYREFHRKDDQSGLRYWRVTSVHKGLAEKEDYSPGRAAERARDHASHFVSVVRDELSKTASDGHDPLLAVTFDSELFGHWWFEGVDWLGIVLREMSSNGPIMSTASEYLGREPPRARIALAEGSWGKNNDHSTWLNEGTAWMWDEIERLATELRALSTLDGRNEFRERASRQATRELLLAESSDWPFLVTTGQAADYAVERFRAHAQRFRRSIALTRAGDPAQDEVELRSLERADNPFPDASLADFAG